MDHYKILWSDKLSIGSDYVDDQHKKLIELIGKVPERSTEGDERYLMQALEYAGSHFEDEEAFMEEIGYPELKAHQRSHKKLTQILLSYKKEYDAGTTDLYAFKQFMFSWVRDHIMDEDKKIGEYLATKKAQS